MVSKKALVLCVLVLLGAICVQAQRDGRRRSGRRKPTTESPPPPAEEPEKEQNPQKLDSEPEAIAKSSSAQPTESETNAPPSDKEQGNANQGGPPFIVPRGTRKPRPHVRNNGESRPRPTLPSFARKRGPKSERRDFKRNDENSVVSTSSTTTTIKPSRDSSRSRGSHSQDRNVNTEKNLQANDEVATETAPKKRFGGNNRRPSRGNRRHNAERTESIE